jgi:hypothetical protein
VVDDEQRQLTATKCWLIVLEVYGSFLPINADEIQDYHAITITALTKAVDELTQLASDSEFLTNPVIVQICKDITNIEACLNKVLQYLIKQPAENKSYSGYLIPLSCGHTGVFNAPERILYESHLRNVSFIN